MIGGLGEPARPAEDGQSRIEESFLYQPTSHRSLGHSKASPDTFHAADQSMIDPALTSVIPGSPEFQSAYPGSRPEQYTQSYERYRSLTPSYSMAAQASAASGMRHTQLMELTALSPNEPLGSPSTSTFSNRSAVPNIESPISTPPFFLTGKDDTDILSRAEFSTERPPKRVRLYQASTDAGSVYDPTMPPPSMHPYTSYALDSHVASSGTPLTPASTHSDEGPRVYTSKLSPQNQPGSPDLRRLSVNSLLSGPAGLPSQKDLRSDGVQDWSLHLVDVYQDTTTYGIDRGFKDLDIGKNDDANAITGSSPIVSRAHFDITSHGESLPFEFGFGMETATSAFESGASYYDKPVEIRIPRILEPLPPKLLQNPMNLLYFHHFLNHTAGCLIPHNCSSNPFKSILPQMAVRDDNLLSLLLAYSASHRARHLRQPEPAVRIAEWVQNIFPSLRHALDDPSAIISNTSLATSIMLASLEIISPKAFGVEVPWQNHLDTARQMMAARGGPQRMQTASRGDHVSSFLWSWFAYLDVLGSLSGGKANSSSSAWILDYDTDTENDYSIDCILGFTSRCVHILAKIAELSRICDNSRIGPDHTIRSEWQPSDDVIARAAKLEADLAESRLHPAKQCTHMQSSGEAAFQWDHLEMAATNEAFHWAGLVHLHRRILGKPSQHDDVQNAVREIFGALFKVRSGSSAEACLLFPMFTAGCDIKDEKQRADILARVMNVERLGMTQVHKARTLMQRVWETGKPWETLVAGEFFG
jgi:hypothetical protein